MTNQELEQARQKAVITTDALAASGKLNPAQADKFIDYVFDETGLKDNARTVRFRNESMNIDKIDIAQRVAMPAAEATAARARRGVTTSQVVLTPRAIVVPFEIGDDFKLNNLEGDAIEDHIIKMMATRTGNNLETLYLEGDGLGRAELESELIEGGDAARQIQDTYLALGQGWLRLADGGNQVDAAAANIGSNLMSRALNAMPTRFKRDMSKLRFLTSVNLEQLFRERISSRATPGGDDALTSIKPLTPFGVPLIKYPLFPHRYREVEHVTLAATTPIALRRGNVANVTVHPATLAATPTTPFIPVTDFTLDAVAGTIARTGGGAINDPTLVKVTYDAPPRIILTHEQNMIVGIGLDISIEKDRDIYARTNQYAIHVKVAVEFEELTALVNVFNVGLG